MANAIDSLPAGAITEPFTVGGQTLVVVEVVKPAHVPAFEEVRAEMQERAFGEVLDHQRLGWLEELRHATYVDVRL